MKVKRLIEMLSTEDQESEVIGWDADSEQYQGLTGLLSSTASKTVTICTDDMGG